VREAAFPVVAFTDDDCVPDRNWITAIHQEFQADPSLAILGGRVEPLEPSDKGLGMRQVSQKIHIESYDLLHHFMIGCNVAIHHKVFEAIGPFDTGLGRGTLIDSGEDRDFLYRALKQGFKIVCSPESLVYHGHGRHTEETIQNCKNTYAQGRGAFYCKHITARDFVILRKALSETFDLIKRGLSYRFQDMKKSNPWTVLRYLTRGAVYQLQRALSPRRKSIPNRTR
jgi:GT2 family glycosyltransferase